MMSEIELLDKFYPNRHKCKCCGGEILYKNFHITKTGNITGTSFKTSKTCDGEVYHLNICENCIREKFTINNMSKTYNVMNEITKYAFDIPDDAYVKSRSCYAMTKSHMIEKYGEEIGVQKWNEYVTKQAKTNTFEYKSKQYGWSKEQFDKYNQSRATTKENLIKRHGHEIGVQKWDKYVKRQAETKSKDYIVGKYGIDEWNRMNSQKKMSLDNMIRLYGPIHGPEQYRKYISDRITPFSKISQECFKKLDEIFEGYETEYASKNHEHVIHSDALGNLYLDFYVPELKLCIEFNGDAFHGNPNKFKDSDHCFPYDKTLTAKDLRSKDEARYNFLKDKYNITTEIIWESDYKDFDKFSIFYQTIKERYGRK